mgnify:CR=1 FL=1
MSIKFYVEGNILWRQCGNGARVSLPIRSSAKLLMEQQAEIERLSGRLGVLQDAVDNCLLDVPKVGALHDALWGMEASDEGN